VEFCGFSSCHLSRKMMHFMRANLHNRQVTGSSGKLVTHVLLASAKPKIRGGFVEHLSMT